MSAPKPRKAVIHTERLALRRQEAAAALSISDESFDKYVRAHVRVVRVGAARLYPVDALREFLAREASSPLEDVGQSTKEAA